MTRLTLPFRLAWMPIAWFLRLLGFGARIKRHSWQPPVDAEHHVWAVVRERRESEGDRARRPAQARPRSAPSSPGADTRVSVLRLTGKALIPAAAILVLAIGVTVGAFAYYTSKRDGQRLGERRNAEPAHRRGRLSLQRRIDGHGLLGRAVGRRRLAAGVLRHTGQQQRQFTANACGTSPTTPTLATGTTCSDNSVSPGNLFTTWSRRYSIAGRRRAR